MKLCSSDNFGKIDLNSERIRKLFQREYKIQDKDGWAAIIFICENNIKFLNRTLK